jgi:hypothetical protein
MYSQTLVLHKFCNQNNQVNNIYYNGNQYHLIFQLFKSPSKIFIISFLNITTIVVGVDKHHDYL